jgi:hypothetical protein
MRLSAGLSLLAASVAVAAPQKDDLPPGAIGRLGTAVSPGTGDRAGEVTALLYLGENTLFVGTKAGWSTWDIQKRQPRQARPVGGPAAAVARDAERLFVGSARKLHAIEPVESAMAEPARSWDSATDLVSVVAADHGSQRVVYADGDQKLTVLDPKSGKASGAVELPGRPVAAALAANGRILAVVTFGGAARVYGLAASGAVEPLWLKRVARSYRAAIQFSPDGRLLAVSSAGRVAVLESVTGRPLTSLDRKFGEADVRAFAFSPDGRRIAAASGGPESVVRIWAVETGQELASYTGHHGDVNAVSFSPDGKTVASAGADQAVLFWKAPPAPDAGKSPTATEAWEAMDSLDAAVAYRAVGALIADPKAALTIVRDGFRGQAAEEAKVRRWIAELDHDEFRVREAARRGLLKAGLRAAAAINEPGRKRLGTEGEERVRLILEAFDQHGLRVPESGLYGEALRLVRGIRVLETVGGADARALLEEMAKGAKDERAAKEARAALEVMPAGR